ncbi:MAG: hypothetical protein GY882_00170 [Actinomycetia bacterium]|nr:hypothetical protein [Actinomycetes bacterium]
MPDNVEEVRRVRETLRKAGSGRIRGRVRAGEESDGGAAASPAEVERLEQALVHGHDMTAVRLELVASQAALAAANDEIDDLAATVAALTETVKALSAVVAGETRLGAGKAPRTPGR